MFLVLPMFALLLHVAAVNHIDVSVVSVIGTDQSFSSIRTFNANVPGRSAVCTDVTELEEEPDSAHVLILAQEWYSSTLAIAVNDEQSGYNVLPLYHVLNNENGVSWLSNQFFDIAVNLHELDSDTYYDSWPSVFELLPVFVLEQMRRGLHDFCLYFECFPISDH